MFTHEELEVLNASLCERLRQLRSAPASPEVVTARAATLALQRRIYASLQAGDLVNGC